MAGSEQVENQREKQNMGNTMKDAFFSLAEVYYAAGTDIKYTILESNQGAGVQTNGDDWEYMESAMVGSGNQGSDIWGNANTGSGLQVNMESLSSNWDDMVNANAGSGAQVVDAENSAGRDRDSNDTLMDALDSSGVAIADLDAAVTGNAVMVSDDGASTSSMDMENGSGFSQMYGVSAVAASTGPNASQNVSVNVTAQVHSAGN